jgi:hypothetical protein
MNISSRQTHIHSSRTGAGIRLGSPIAKSVILGQALGYAVARLPSSILDLPDGGSA